MLDADDRQIIYREALELGETSEEIAEHFRIECIYGSPFQRSPVEIEMCGICGSDEAKIVGTQLRLAWNASDALRSTSYVPMPPATIAFHEAFMRGEYPLLEAGVRASLRRVFSA